MEHGIGTGGLLPDGQQGFVVAVLWWVVAVALVVQVQQVVDVLEIQIIF